MEIQKIRQRRFTNFLEELFQIFKPKLNFGDARMSVYLEEARQHRRLFSKFGTQFQSSSVLHLTVSDPSVLHLTASAFPWVDTLDLMTMERNILSMVESMPPMAKVVS